jgi:hypothetical protein
MDEPSVTSANLDQTEQDFLAREVPDEINGSCRGGTSYLSHDLRRLAINDRRML